MKLPFGIEVKRFQKPKTKRVSPEIGGTGTSFFGGIFSGVDYNVKLDVSTKTGLNTIEEMLNSDATVKAALNIIELPLKRAKWIIEYEEDDDIKEFVEQSLFEDMDRSWIELLDEILDYLPFGHSVFEKVFKITDKGIQWAKWGTRLQTSIQKWEMSNGDLGIQQYLSGKEAKEKTSSPEIPWEKLIIFTNEQKGINVTGKSILRSAYKNWFMKTAIEKIDAIAHERQGIGVPVIRSPGAYSWTDKRKAENIAKNYRANEEAYVYLPGGVEGQRWEFEIINQKANNLRDPHKSLQYHDRQILKNVLAQFINLGAVTAGTRNVGEVQSEIFFLSIEAIGEFISHVVNTIAIKELVDLNFGEQEIYPKLRAINIRQTNITKFADAISKLVTANIITPEDGLEEHARELMKLSSLPDELKGVERKQSVSPSANTTNDQVEEEVDEVIKNKKKEMSIKKNIMKFSEKSISKREKVFLQQVVGLRKDLESFYQSKFKKDFDEYQYQLRKALVKGYSESSNKTVNGVKVLSNSKNKTELITKVKNITKKFKRRSLQNNRQGAIHEIAINRANKAIQGVEKQEFALKSNVSAMLRLYKYNVDAWFYRESRHIIESIEDNFVGAKSTLEAIKNASELKLSEMIYRLSTLTHPEALFRNMIYKWGSGLGFNHWKAIIASSDLNTIQLNGITMAILYMILTKDQWDKKLEKDNVVSSMGIHYNGQVFFYPVSEALLTEEEKIAKEQRKEFLNWLNKEK